MLPMHQHAQKTANAPNVVSVVNNVVQFSDNVCSGLEDSKGGQHISEQPSDLMRSSH